jgi:membrane-associated phospholipid phosphatase
MQGGTRRILLGSALLGGARTMSKSLEHRGATRLDRGARQLAISVQTPALTLLAQRIERVANVGVLTVAFGIAGVAVREKSSRARLFSGAALRAGLEPLCKFLFRRRRPPPWMQIGVKRGSSLPSGHSLDVAPLLLAASCRKEAAARPIAWMLAALISVSRVYLRKHHLTDVVSGLLFGAGAASLTDGALRLAGLGESGLNATRATGIPRS